MSPIGSAEIEQRSHVGVLLNNHSAQPAMNSCQSNSLVRITARSATIHLQTKVLSPNFYSKLIGLVIVLSAKIAY